MFERKPGRKLCDLVIGEIKFDDLGEVLEVIVLLENEFLFGQNKDSNLLGMLNVA